MVALMSLPAPSAASAEEAQQPTAPAVATTRKRLMDALEEATAVRYDVDEMTKTQRREQPATTSSADSAAAEGGDEPAVVETSAPPSPVAAKRPRIDAAATTKAVRFSAERPTIVPFDNFAHAANEEERYAIRKSIWYTRKEFDEFLKDRVHTIRVWRSVGGDLSRELQNHYCLRGLEPYQSPSLNAEMHSQRLMHQRGVLSEQARQIRQEGCVYDPRRIAQQVSHLSEYAMQRARRLALLDQDDAAEYCSSSNEGKSANSHKKRQQRSRTSSSRQGSHNRRSSISIAPSSSSSRTSIMMSSFSERGTSGSSSRMNTITGSPSHTDNGRRMSMQHAQQQQQHPFQVDVHRLKEMNVQFLKSIMTGSSSPPATNHYPSAATTTAVGAAAAAAAEASSLRSSSSSSSSSSEEEGEGDDDTNANNNIAKDRDAFLKPLRDANMCLTNLLIRKDEMNQYHHRHRTAAMLQMQQQHQQQQQQQQHHEHHHHHQHQERMARSQRRHSVGAGCSVSANDLTAFHEHPFLAVRRDSLHNGGSIPHHQHQGHVVAQARGRQHQPY